MDRPNLYYGVEFKNEIVFPILPDGTDGCWRWSQAKLKKSIEDGDVVLIEKEGKKNYMKKYTKKMVQSR